MTLLMAEMPFLTPMQAVQPVWYLLAIPFAILISMIWKAIRVRDLADDWRHVAVMATLVVVGLFLMAVMLMLLVEVGIPAMPLQRP
jgi:hypothetical protein